MSYREENPRAIVRATVQIAAVNLLCQSCGEFLAIPEDDKITWLREDFIGLDSACCKLCGLKNSLPSDAFGVTP